jgi:hypothetical protein
MSVVLDTLREAPPSELGAAFERHVLTTFGLEPMTWSDTWPSVYERLSDGLTVDRDVALRGKASGGWGDDEARLVATLAFGQRTFLSAVPLLRTYGGLPGPVIDLGSGSGAAALAATVCGAPRVTLVDADAKTVRWGARLVAGSGALVDAVVGDLVGAPIASDVVWVLAAFSLNEVLVRRPALDGRLGALLEGWMASGRRVLVLEPGTHEASRRLQRARDSLTDRTRILGPCTHAALCPMLKAGERDWCHLTRPSWLGPIARRILRMTGRDDSATHLSWLALGPGSQPPGESRVLDMRTAGKGKSRFLVCDAGGLRELTALTRHRSPLTDLEPGAVVRIPGDALEVRGDGLRVSAPDRVDVVRSV